MGAAGLTTLGGCGTWSLVWRSSTRKATPDLSTLSVSTLMALSLAPGKPIFQLRSLNRSLLSLTAVALTHVVVCGTFALVAV